jgi:hypothetical protein
MCPRRPLFPIIPNVPRGEHVVKWSVKKVTDSLSVQVNGVGGCVAGDGTHNPPIIRENQVPEQMFCPLRLANPYRIDRHSYSAI